jgi:Protein of unknown function (DUF3606)
MKKDGSQSGGQFLTDISVGQEYEVRYWTWKFGVTSEQLLEAVKCVGTNAGDVEKHLKGTTLSAGPL